jgi:SPP1 family predicted phage head-tail adaptor
MRIGELNKRIDIQAQQKTPDGAGGFSTVWVSVLPTGTTTIAAAIWPISAKEIIAANSTTMIISHRIRIRYRNGIKASNRIKFANRYFNIVSIIDQNMQHKWLDILVKEAA